LPRIEFVPPKQLAGPSGTPKRRREYFFRRVEIVTAYLLRAIYIINLSSWRMGENELAVDAQLLKAAMRKVCLCIA
jgi:hypothetical protein